MMQLFGNIENTNGKAADIGRLRLADGALDISWHHCSTTADFLGDFFATQTRTTDLEYNEIRHGIGYLVNELQSWK